MSGALVGLRVVEIGRGVAAPLAGALLADQGADVVAAALPGGPEAADEAGRSRGKRRLEAGAGPAALQALVERADVLLSGLAPGALKALGVDLAAARGRNPGLISCAIPAFSGADPRAELPDFEGAIGAVGGLYEVPLGRRPAWIGLPVASTLAAIYAADAVIAALIARLRDGLGQAVEVPRYDALLTALELPALLLVDPPKVWDSLRWAATPFIGGYRCRDGRWIYLHAGLSKHAERLVAALRSLGERSAAARLEAVLSPETLADPSSVRTVGEARAVRAALSRTFLQRDAAEWERLLGEAGLCAAICLSSAEWRDHPHARASGQVVALEAPGGGEVHTPGLQVHLSETPGAVGPLPGAPVSVDRVLAGWPAPAPAPARPCSDPPLAGLRVLDLTQVIAGPVAARTLAELGAEVLRVENPHFSAGWVEPFHLLFNRGKRSVALDLSTAAGLTAFKALVARFKPDVVVENLRPGAADRLGIGEAALRAMAGDIVYLHLDAYGPAGPWRERPGWEQTAQAAAGIQVAYGGAQTPDLYPLPVNDLGTGLAGAYAALLALYRRAAGGGGQRAQTCLTATATLLRAAAIGGAAEPGPLGEGPLSRFYQLGDQWAYLGAREEDFSRLGEVPGLEALVGRTPQSSAELLAELLAAAPLETWQGRLRRARLEDRVALVPWTRRATLLRDAGLEERGMLWSREEPGVGTLTEIGFPVNLARTPARPVPPAPGRGADAGEYAPASGLGLPAPRRPSRAAWLRSQVSWALYLASTRI